MAIVTYKPRKRRNNTQNQSSVMLHGQIVEVAVPIEARPGDLLLVVNGVCLGLHKPESSVVETINNNSILAAIPQGQPLYAKEISDKLGLRRDDAASRGVVGQILRRMIAEKLIKIHRMKNSRIPKYTR